MKVEISPESEGEAGQIDMLTIQTWGGWGDVLREISLLPVPRRMPSAWGVSLALRVRHLSAEHIRVHADARVPSAESVREMLERCPGLRWGGVGPVARRWKAAARGIRALIEPFHPGLFDPGFDWRDNDMVPLEPGCRHIVVQTHLEGLPAKRWTLTGWRQVLDGLKIRYPDAILHVLDPAGAALVGERIVVHDSLSFPAAVNLVERCDLLVSVDSWSKYVAGWKGIPQVVIEPDQTPDYPRHTASTIWRHSFRGLHKNKNLTLLGLAPDGTKRARYTFGPMSNLRPQDVLRALPALGTS